MAHRTRSSSKFYRHKAQFFILAVAIIVTVLFFISRLLEPSSVIDTSQAPLTEEAFVFDNIKEKVMEVVRGSKTCQDLKFNLEDYKMVVENYILEKGMRVDYNYTVAPCPEEAQAPAGSPSVVLFKVSLSSPKALMYSNFSIGWPA